jgi:hypothetical protein
LWRSRNQLENLVKLRNVRAEGFFMGDCKKGLDDRCRDDDGEIRHKRRDTLVSTLRETYGDDFAPGASGRMKLGALLEREDATSLTELLKRHKK